MTHNKRDTPARQNRTRTNVSVDLETYYRLRQLGRLGDTFSDVIKALLDEREAKQQQQQQQQQKEKAEETAIPAK